MLNRTPSLQFRTFVPSFGFATLGEAWHCQTALKNLSVVLNRLGVLL